eukprot:4483626-Karenia_brevis.AAC.1
MALQIKRCTCRMAIVQKLMFSHRRVKRAHDELPERTPHGPRSSNSVVIKLHCGCVKTIAIRSFLTVSA